MPLILDTSAESAAAPAADPSLWRFHAITHDWRRNLLWKDYRRDPELFQVTVNPEEADHFVFPYLLDEMIETLGAARVSALLRRLPFFPGNERRHVFMTLHDSSECFGIESIFFRASIARSRRDAGASAHPYAVEDLIQRTHFDPSRIRYDASFVGFVGCPVSGPVRRRMIASLAKTERIRAFISPSDRFHGQERGARRAERRGLFLQSVADSWTVVCPRGTGRNTYRFFETLSMGRIPVLLSDDCVLPFEDQVAYDAFMLRIPEREAGQTADILGRWLETETAESLLARCRKARQAWERHFACPKWVPQMIAHLRRSAAAPRPQVVVDGVIFQLQRKNPYGISRMWRSLLTEIGRGPLAERVVLLDREGSAPPIAGIRTRRVPSFRLGKAPAEAEFLDAVCREERAGLFLSTYYTGTRETPSLLMLYDMIPESADAVGPDAGSPEWRDKHWAIRNAGAFAAISQATASGLKRYYPERAEPPPAVIPLAVSEAFRPRAPEEIAALRQADGPDRPYFLWVGRRDPHKNADLFFKAFARLPERERYAIVFAGGASALEPAWRELAGGAPVYTGFFPDEKLAWLYAGALALVYPSRGEGFGLPVLEAMRSGCPVITCHNSSLFEIARSAALYVDEEDPADLAQRLMDVQQPEVRRYLIAAGHAEARRYSWSRSAALLTAAIESRLQARVRRSDSYQTIGGH